MYNSLVNLWVRKVVNFSCGYGHQFTMSLPLPMPRESLGCCCVCNVFANVVFCCCLVLGQFGIVAKLSQLLCVVRILVYLLQNFHFLFLFTFFYHYHYHYHYRYRYHYCYRYLYHYRYRYCYCRIFGSLDVVLRDIWLEPRPN